MVIADPWWNPAAENQASGRAHRIGQQRPLYTTSVTAEVESTEAFKAQHSAKLVGPVLNEARASQEIWPMPLRVNREGHDVAATGTWPLPVLGTLHRAAEAP